MGFNLSWSSMNIESQNKLSKQVSNVGLFANIFLSIAKLAVGIIGASQALISDAINSIGDVFATFVVLIGVKESKKAADTDHPFGHERLDSVAAIILAIFFFLTAFFIGFRAVSSILEGINGEIPLPSNLTWIVAVIAIAIKEGLFIYTANAAKLTGSTALKGSAYDHQADVISTTGSLIGIVGARIFSLPILDPIFSLFIGVLIVITGIRVFKEAIERMIDKSIDEEDEKAIIKTVEEVVGVEQIDMFRSRIFGNRIYVDIDIAVDADLSLEEAHTIAENVHDRIEQDYPLVKHIMVHVNPLNAHIETNPK